MTQVLRTLFFLLLLTSVGFAQQPTYEPAWSNIPARRVIEFKPDARNDIDRGKALVTAIAQLQPGDTLQIPAGTYSVNQLWDITCSGTEQAPVRIVAKSGDKVVVTRPDNRQNVINVGMEKPVQFLLFEGLEITGGSHGLRLGAGNDVWFHRCHFHHTGEVCLSANSKDTKRIFITENEIHHPGGTAEGMYLGGNDGSVIMSESVIAKNHVYECRGSQGDGIELKQGSWGNLIAENKVHDCNYPCITVYGTAGKKQNIIERNLCYRSKDAAMQVQGEAIVRNNILIGGDNGGFVSTDHQGKTINLQVIHNTIINVNHAFRGGSWNDRDGMVLANNIIYSQTQNAFHFPNGSTKVTIVGNVVLGDGQKFNSKVGNGLDDFQNISWDAADLKPDKFSVAPKSKSYFAGSAEYRVDEDYFGRNRNTSDVVSGAVLP